MATIKKILITLDVYHDYRDDPSHQPLEVGKAIKLFSDPGQAQIFLVGCGFEAIFWTPTVF